MRFKTTRSDVEITGVQTQDERDAEAKKRAVDVDAADEPEAKRANVAGFFRILGVNSLTGFKKRFYAEHLPEPHPGMKPLIAEKVRPGRVANDESEKTGLSQGHSSEDQKKPAGFSVRVTSKKTSRRSRAADDSPPHLPSSFPSPISSV